MKLSIKDMISKISLLTNNNDTILSNLIERKNLSSITKLPDFLNDITKIEDYAFNNSDLALTSLPEGITSIGQSAFENCDNLALTSLPEGITKIYGSAFSNCTGLTLTSLPSSLTYLGNHAFYGCTGLTSITFKGIVSPGTFTFDGCPNLVTINVPWAEGEVANAPWGATNATINYNYTET